MARSALTLPGHFHSCPTAFHLARARAPSAGSDGGDFPRDGMEYHLAFMAEGNLRVSEVWDSQEKFEAFGQRLMPILAEVGIDPGTPEILEVHNSITR
jgi:hypothetical protein